MNQDFVDSVVVKRRSVEHVTQDGILPSRERLIELLQDAEDTAQLLMYERNTPPLQRVLDHLRGQAEDYTIDHSTVEELIFGHPSTSDEQEEMVTKLLMELEPHIEYPNNLWKVNRKTRDVEWTDEVDYSVFKLKQEARVT